MGTSCSEYLQINLNIHSVCCKHFIGYESLLFSHSVLQVKLQTYKTAVETAILLLRIDGIVSGSKKKGDKEVATPAEIQREETQAGGD